MLIGKQVLARPYSGYGVYLYATFFDFVIPIFGSLGLFFLFTREAMNLATSERTSMMLGFLAGAMSLEPLSAW